MSKCKLCDEAEAVSRANFLDGSGSWRVHAHHFCSRNSWFSRHWFVTMLAAVCIVGLAGGALSRL